jgi:hypothetical protein
MKRAILCSLMFVMTILLSACETEQMRKNEEIIRQQREEIRQLEEQMRQIREKKKIEEAQ